MGTQCSTNKPTRALQNETVDSSRCFERCLGGTFQSAAGERSTSRHRLVQKRNQPGWKLPTHSRVKTASKWKKADRRSRWATKPKKREPYPKEATPSPRPKVSYSPSTGWLTKTDSKPAATICPRPLPCPPTSSNF